MKSNLILTFRGKSQCLASWCDELRLPYSTISARLSNGWSVEKALSTPSMGRSKVMSVHWTQLDRGLSWRRSDGATVRYNMGPDKMQFIAFKPDPSDEYLARPCGRSKVFTGPRSWKTPEAAMRAVDKEFPLRAEAEPENIENPLSPLSKP